ncbi:putative protease Do-like 14 [Daucus carota subsp. sativus]|uniref:putative protease Do-like 14 n=1 Tax=Daucus carota subsp. sativus TaxID=79200 RepID=UPI0030831E63
MLKRAGVPPKKLLLNGTQFRWNKYFIHDFGRFCSNATNRGTNTKKSVLKAASSVVSLTAYSGDNRIFICSGFIMECDNICGTFMGTILTSATLLRSASDADMVADDLKIDVYMAGGTFFRGEVLAVDFHYNIAIIKINSDVPLPTSTIRLIDTHVPIDPGNCGSIEDFKLSRCTERQDSATSADRFSLYPGMEVFALGRYFRDSYDIMAAPGEFRYGGCDFDCQELLSASCLIKKNGIGGPLINFLGEVIGINFYEVSYTPFLPINIAYQCYRDLKKQCRIPRPWIGLSVIDLYAGSLHELEILHEKFPHVVKGAMVKEALPESPACIAALHVGDVITSCDGNLVRSCLELTEALWNKEGKSVELVVVRASADRLLNLVVEVVETNPNTYRWPVPEQQILRNCQYA